MTCHKWSWTVTRMTAMSPITIRHSVSIKTGFGDYASQLTRNLSVNEIAERNLQSQWEMWWPWNPEYEWAKVRKSGPIEFRRGGFLLVTINICGRKYDGYLDISGEKSDDLEIRIMHGSRSLKVVPINSSEGRFVMVFNSICGCKWHCFRDINDETLKFACFVYPSL